MSSKKYKKRQGTSGISGQLYEINLISLILHKLHHSSSIEDFTIASNMDDLGAFDDICLKIKFADLNKPIYVFIQAKHKDDSNTYLQYELIKRFYNSYMKIKKAFYVNKDVFFNEKFDEIDSIFILYTNAKYFNDLNGGPSQTRSLVSNYLDKLNDLIATGEKGCQAQYTIEDLELINSIIVEEEINRLSEHFVKFLQKTNQSMNIMLDDYILQYHVILANTIVNISNIKTDEKNSQWRELTFRSDFFNSDNKINKLLKKYIFMYVFKTITDKNNKKRDNDKYKAKSNNESDSLNADVDDLIFKFLSEPSAITLSHLIGTHIICKDNNLQFISKRSSADIQKLTNINLESTIIEEAREIAVKNILISLELKVPVTFGNLDIAIGGNDKKVEKRLYTLSELFVDLCKTSQLIDAHEIVVIDANVGDGFLSLNGGIASAIGNLLIYDNVTGLLRLTEEPSTLSINAQNLFTKLSNRIKNLSSYRFDITALIKLPKLVFDFTETAKLILNKVIIYENQGNHRDVAEILKKEIDKFHANGHDPIKPEIICVQYCHEIQKWWMSLKTATYLTKSDDKIYQQAKDNILTEPQISVMQTTFYLTNLNYFRCIFNKSEIDRLKILESFEKCIITTNIPMLTATKVIQYLRDKSPHIIVDLEYVLNLNENIFNALHSEIVNTERVAIILCDDINNSRNLHIRLAQIVQGPQNKKLIIITKNELVEVIQQYCKYTYVMNEDNPSLTSLTEKSQNNIAENAVVIFQGQRIFLDSLIDEKSRGLIKGQIFNHIVRNEIIKIGKLPISAINNKLSDLYAVKIDTDDNNSTDNYYLLEKCNIDQDAVLMTAEIELTSLLSYLSLKTKEHDMLNKKPIRWIEIINLIYYPRIFCDWQENKTEIDTLKTLNFVCQVILENNVLDHSKVFYNKNNIVTDLVEKYNLAKQFISKSNITLGTEGNNVYLKHCTGDEWVTFELNIFLHLFNEGKVVFAFDVSEDIFPHYKDSLITFLKVIKNIPQNKLWITTRPKTNILPDLKRVIGKCYDIKYGAALGYKRSQKMDYNEHVHDIYLVSFILFKLEHDKAVEDFSLAVNMDGIGTFNSICLKLKLTEYQRPMFAFIKTKFRLECDDNTPFPKNQLLNDFYTSYVKIKNKFNTSDSFFDENFDEIDIFFIFYTNQKYSDYNFKTLDENSAISKLKGLIVTELGLIVNLTNEDIELINNLLIEEEIIKLPKNFVKYINQETSQSINILLNNMLINGIVNISKVQTDLDKSLQWRELTFNSNFFNYDDEFIKLFRKSLSAEVFNVLVKKHKEDIQFDDSTVNSDEVDDLISKFLTNPSADTLSPLIGTQINYRYGNFMFMNERPHLDCEAIEDIKLSSDIIKESKEIAARNMLLSLKIKVPVTFGNLNLVDNAEQLTEYFFDLCRTYLIKDSYKIVVLNENKQKGGFVNVFSAVGNLLDYESDKLLKFTENPALLQAKALIVYNNLNNRISNLDLYRFDVELVEFPKFNLDFTEEAKLILKNLFISDNQDHYMEIIDKFEHQIESHDINLSTKSEAIRKFYCQEIHKLIMSTNFAPYLTKSTDNIFKRILKNLKTEPQLSEMQTVFFNSNLKYFDITFDTDTLDELTLNNRPFIKTDNPNLSTKKVVQCLQGKNRTANAVVDLEYTFNLQENDFIELKSELANTDKVLIIACNMMDIHHHSKLNQIAKATEGKRVVIVAPIDCIEILGQYFLLRGTDQ